jgi:hypothetical protein
MESNGIRIDVPYLKRAIKETGREIQELETGFTQNEVYKHWVKMYGDRTKLNAREQLVYTLFDMGIYAPGYGVDEDGKKVFRSEYTTASGRLKADESVLSKVKHPFVKTYLHSQKLRKLRKTYLKGVLNEVVGEFLHPVFNLHTVATFRSSSSQPNFQNFPIRNKVLGRWIRQAFIARPGHRLVEVDFSGIEVRVSACVHRDPNLINYINDPSTDMHRDTAADLFMLSVDYLKKNKDWAKKGPRDWAKNRFVFPQFYGSVYFQCAPHIWEAVEEGECLMPDTGLPIEDYLASRGIMSLGNCDPRGVALPGTFAFHVRKVEQSFWEERFCVYSEWKERFWRRYQERGCFDLVTGFRVGGPMKRNEVLNYPIQGPAFHCLLWSIIQIHKELNRRGMRTKLVGQIHDSLLADVPEDELQDFLDLAHEVMTVRLVKHWDWFAVPMETESEVTPVGGEGSWCDKKVWINPGGVWKEKPKDN